MPIVDTIDLRYFLLSYRECLPSYVDDPVCYHGYQGK